MPLWPWRPGPVIVETCLTELALKFVAQVGSSIETSEAISYYNHFEKVVKGL
jgi:hypothetical protein